ncbi:MAG TPA: hypothetical protein VFV86_08420 [Nitrososphaeraceae archaeon]|nr:hypothetical protein [Nitrososphaeraceae archaeon]
MKRFDVKKGKYNFKPFTFGLFWKKKVLDYNVMFDSSCRYKLDNEHDTNKLIGIGYFSFGWNPHQTDSARFGWRYDDQKDKIEILAYCYVNKERVIRTLGFCDFYTKYNIVLSIEDDTYNFFMSKQNSSYGQGLKIPKDHSKKLSFLLTPWFGGNFSAPNKMTLYLQKLK